MVAITALLFLFVLGFIIKHRILRPVVTLSDVVNRLATQDYAVETPVLAQVDEIGDMAQAIHIFVRTVWPDSVWSKNVMPSGLRAHCWRG